MNLLGECNADVLGHGNLGPQIRLSQEHLLAHVLAAVDGVGVHTVDALALDDALAHFDALVGNEVKGDTMVEKLSLDIRVRQLALFLFAVCAGDDDDGFGDVGAERQQ